MPKFATKAMRPKQRAPINATGYTPTYQGGAGAERDPKSELFLLAISNLVSEDTFYESGKGRDARYASLVKTVTNDDPEWVAALVPYLRDELNLRSVAVVTACEYVAGGGPFGRPVISAACRRADEPAEVLAYWQANYGRALPMPVKRGLGDAATRLYNENSMLRYDGTERPIRFADVLELAHPIARASWQNALFKHAIDRRHNHDDEIPEVLGRITVDKMLREMEPDARRSHLAMAVSAGWSWERLGSWLPGGMDAQAWEAIVPNMGYMALLRNLRNFDKAKLSDVAIKPILDRLMDPDEVARSRQLPFRFYSAWREVQSLRWAYAIELALAVSMQNVPSLPGRTLTLLDLSPSMANQVSMKSERQLWELASIFGIALSQRAESADLIGYSGDSANMGYDAPLLRMVDGIRTIVQHGNGTYTGTALQRHYAGHDRVIIITDGQAHDDVGAAMDSCHKPNGQPPTFYSFNIGGYRPAHAATGVGRYEFGGLSDAGFTLLSLLESGKDGDWPHISPTTRAEMKSAGLHSLTEFNRSASAEQHG